MKNGAEPPEKRQRIDKPQQQGDHQPVDNAVAGPSNIHPTYQQQAGHNHIAPGVRNDKPKCSTCNTTIAEATLDEHWQKMHNRWVAPQQSEPSTGPQLTSSPRPKFRCTKCDRVFYSSYYLKLHIDMHTRKETSRYPHTDSRILRRHLNDSIEAECKICHESIILNRMADHMIEAHIPRDDSLPHREQSNVSILLIV